MIIIDNNDKEKFKYVPIENSVPNKIMSFARVAQINENIYINIFKLDQVKYVPLVENNENVEPALSDVEKSKNYN